MPWAIGGLGLGLAVVVGIVVWWWLRRRRQSRHRMISFVALLREPAVLDAESLAQTAGRAWKCDLGDGTNEGADGDVVCTGPFNMISCRGHVTLVNCFPAPYTQDVDGVADKIADLRLRSLFRQHRAWLSCDAMGLDDSPSEDDTAAAYRRLGRLFADLLDDNCLMIFIPDLDMAFPINDTTMIALRSKDPIARLQDTMTVPITEVSADDPRMKRAAARARETWPQFVAAFEANDGDGFSVKAPVSAGDNTEFIWIEVTSIEGDRVYGTLGNDPGDLGNLKFGSKVSVLVAELNDWLYKDRQDKVQGGFTIEVVQNAMKRKPRAK